MEQILSLKKQLNVYKRQNVGVSIQDLAAHCSSMI